MKPLVHTVSGAVALLFLCAAPHIQAASSFIVPTEQQNTATLSTPTKDDAFVTGNVVSVTAPVGGELFAGGNTVSVTQRVGRSMYLAGSTVTIEQGSEYNTFAVGNTVVLSGTYGHDVYVAGNTVTIKDGTVIDGDLRIAGSVVSIAGTIKGAVYVAGSQVNSSATIGNSFSGEGGAFSFSGGSIAGNLSYQSTQNATSLDKVLVSGKTQRSDPPQPTKTPLYLVVLGWVGSLLSVFILGAFVMLLLPKKVESLVGDITKNWSKGVAYGIIALIAAPIAIGIAFATVVAWNVGLILLALYVSGLLVAHALANIVLGRLILQRFKGQYSQWLALVIGLVVMGLVTAIPLVGWVFSTAFFFGLTVPTLGFLVAGVRKTY